MQDLLGTSTVRVGWLRELSSTLIPLAVSMWVILTYCTGTSTVPYFLPLPALLLPVSIISNSLSARCCHHLSFTAYLTYHIEEHLGMPVFASYGVGFAPFGALCRGSAARRSQVWAVLLASTISFAGTTDTRLPSRHGWFICI